MWRAWCTMSFLHKFRKWIRLSKEPFCLHDAFCRKQPCNGLLQPKFCPTQSWVSQTSYPSRLSQWFPICLTYQIWTTASSSIPKAEYHTQKKMISTQCTDKTNYNLAGHSRIVLLQMCCKVGGLLESTHIVWSNALYRRRQSNLLSALVLLEWILSWILFGQPSFGFSGSALFLVNLEKYFLSISSKRRNVYIIIS